MPRIFIAAFLPENIKNDIAAIIEDCKHNFHGVRWEKSSKIHITLKFIGSVDDITCKEVLDRVKNIAKRAVPVTLNLSHLDAFPDFRRPNVIVLRLKNSQGLLDLNNLLEGQLAGLGIKIEERLFIPHITIGRVKKKFGIKDKPIKISKKEFIINSIGVVESVLKKEGSEYINLGVYKLT